MCLIKTILTGDYGLFLESMISRLKKESVETFVITGSNIKNVQMHNNIIEEYNFKYDNGNIHYILESTKPEVVIFTGALDPIFSWEDQSDAVSYIAGLNNMLISAAKSGVKRFIYISSTDIYDKAQNGNIDEESNADPKDLKSMTIKNGEDISLRHNQESMQVIILRCSEVFGFHNDKINNQNYLTKICLDALDGNIPHINVNKKHDNININDVVETTYKVMTQEKVSHNIYNISTGKGITEENILMIIEVLVGKEYKAKRNKDSIEPDSQYSNELAVKDLNFSIKNSFQYDFKRLFDYLKENESLYLKKHNEGNVFTKIKTNLKSIFGWFFPYFETVVAFILIHLIVLFVGDSTYMEVFDFYLLYVVMIAIIYGKGQTITALLLSLIGKISILQQDVSIFNIIVDYNTYVWMLQLLIIGMGIGYIRDRYQQSIDDKEENITYLESELTEIKEINDSNIRLKKIFEDRLINYEDSFARIYSIVTELDELEPDKIMFAAVDVVSQIMKSEDIVIYSIDKGSVYARLTASSANLEKGAPKSIRLDSLQEIHEEVLKHRIYINRSMDPDKPSMVGGVYHEDTLESIVMIWSLPFENATLYHMNLFSVVLNLIAQAMHLANQYIEESKLNRYLAGTSILTEKSFQRILEITQAGFERNLADYYILEITNTNYSLQQLNDIIVPISRENDYLGIFNDNLCLLLTNTNEEEAEFVIMRLAQKSIRTREDVRYIYA